MSVAVRVLRLPHGEGLPLPSYQSAHAAGFDLVAAVPEDGPVSLAPSDRVLIPTGLAFALSEGHEAQIRPRSGLALKHGVTVLNSPGLLIGLIRSSLGLGKELPCNLFARENRRQKLIFLFLGAAGKNCRRGQSP